MNSWRNSSPSVSGAAMAFTRIMPVRGSGDIPSVRSRTADVCARSDHVSDMVNGSERNGWNVDRRDAMVDDDIEKWIRSIFVVHGMCTL